MKRHFKSRAASVAQRNLRVKHPAGFTLLEILLATAVLLVGLVAVFQTTKSAFTQRARTKELSSAQNACQTVLNELLARSAPIQPNEGRAVDHLPHWTVKIDIYPASQSGLYVLHLSAQHILPEGTLSDIKYQLLRWVPAERVQVAESSETPFAGSEFEDLFQPEM